MKTDVIGIGICTADFLLTVAQMPGYGGSVYARDYLRQSGGLVSTALVTLARLGVSTRIVARIGDDNEGAFIRQTLEKEGVSTQYLLSEPNTTSHISIVIVDQHTGERSFISRWETGSPLQISDLPHEAVSTARILLIDNINAVTLQAIQWAKEAGTKVILDPSKSFQEMKAILPLVDVPIVPEQFVQNWLPHHPPEVAAEKLYNLGAEIAVVTLGARGCIVYCKQGLRSFKAFPIDVVDTTGAGDAFHGGFIYGLLQDWTIEKTTRFASAVGALNCRHLGGCTGLPTLQEVEHLLCKYPKL